MRKLGNYMRKAMFLSKAAIFAGVVSALFFTACEKKSDEATPESTVVEPEFLITDEDWYTASYEAAGTITVSEDSVVLSDGVRYSEVKTRGGGEFAARDAANFTSGKGGIWRYLYAGKDKIGIALYSRSTESVIFLGRSFIANRQAMFSELGIKVDTNGMQNTLSGSSANWTNRYAVYVTNLSSLVPVPVLRNKTIDSVSPVGDDDWLVVREESIVENIPQVRITLDRWHHISVVSGGGETAVGKDSVLIKTADGMRLLFVVNQSHTEEGAGGETGFAVKQ